MTVQQAPSAIPFADGDQRDEIRRPITMEAKCREYGSFRTEVYLLDLSARGCKVETGLRIRPGQAVLLTLDDLEPRSGHVRWSDQGTMGCQFNEPLSNEALAHLAARRT